MQSFSKQKLKPRRLRGFSFEELFDVYYFHRFLEAVEHFLFLFSKCYDAIGDRVNRIISSDSCIFARQVS